jgi:hypothetical protein
MDTVVVQMSETANASFLTSTSIAKAYSQTPTNFGAPTATATFTPNASELTATAAAPTTTPMEGASRETTKTSPIFSPTVVQTPEKSRRPRIPEKAEYVLVYGCRFNHSSSFILCAIQGGKKMKESACASGIVVGFNKAWQICPGSKAYGVPHNLLNHI